MNSVLSMFEDANLVGGKGRIERCHFDLATQNSQTHSFAHYHTNFVQKKNLTLSTLSLHPNSNVYFLTCFCYCSHFAGKSFTNINDELIMVAIGMAIAILILITLALCHIAREKWCRKRREYYVTA